MKKKIIGILVCMLLMTTSVLAMGVIDTSKTEVVKENIRNFKDDNKQQTNGDCGSVTIILTGNESCMIGAKIRLYTSFGLMIGARGITIQLGTFVSKDVELIQDPDNPFNGSYGAKFDICGFYRVVYIPPDGSNCTSAYKPYVILRPGEVIDIYQVIPIDDGSY